MAKSVIWDDLKHVRGRNETLDDLKRIRRSTLTETHMLFKSLVLTGLLALSTITQPAIAADHIGLKELTIATKEPGRSLQTFVIYPAGDGGTKAIVGENRIITGYEAWRDAPIAPGRHPLILISHGSGGNVLGLSWLTTRLASLGYIVVGPNHPGTMSGDSDPKRTVEVWHRPMDLSVTLDTLLADPALSASIDATNIGALGFSLGGYDVLALVGAQQNRQEFAQYCFSNAGATLGFCHWLVKGGVDLTALDPRFEDNHRDPRIKAIVAVDPGFTPSFTDASLKAVRTPVLFLNMGTPVSTPGAVETHHLAELIPGARLARVPDAVHFSFLGLCKPDGAKFLEQIGDDPICTDAGGRDRAALHEDMLKATTAFLAEHLPVGK